MDENKLKDFLDSKAERYNQPSFIKDDPICIPHLFSKKQDIEIAAFFAAIFAWGNRTTIINKSRDLKKLVEFKHRTFNATDLLYFIEFFKSHYLKSDSLETAFLKHMKPGDSS